MYKTNQSDQISIKTADGYWSENCAILHENKKRAKKANKMNIVILNFALASYH